MRKKYNDGYGRGTLYLCCTIFAHVVMYKVQLLFKKHQLYFFVTCYRGIIAPWDLDIVKSPLIKWNKAYNPKALSTLKGFCNELLVSRCRKTPSVLHWLLLNGDPWERAVGWEQRRGHSAAREGRHRKMTDEKDIWEKKQRGEWGGLKWRSYRGGSDMGAGGWNEGRSWFSVEGALSLG